MDQGTLTGSGKTTTIANNPVNQGVSLSRGSNVSNAIESLPNADMTKAVYDPTAKNADAFSMSNMVEGASAKILTSAERTILSNISGTNTGDQIISDATVSFTNITTGNVSTSMHGFFPKLPTSTGLYLKDDLTWAAPSSSGTTKSFAVAMAVALG